MIPATVPNFIDFCKKHWMNLHEIKNANKNRSLRNAFIPSLKFPLHFTTAAPAAYIYTNQHAVPTQTDRCRKPCKTPLVYSFRLFIRARLRIHNGVTLPAGSELQ